MSLRAPAIAVALALAWTASARAQALPVRVLVDAAPTALRRANVERTMRDGAAALFACLETNADRTRLKLEVLLDATGQMTLERARTGATGAASERTSRCLQTALGTLRVPRAVAGELIVRLMRAETLNERVPAPPVGATHAVEATTPSSARPPPSPVSAAPPERGASAPRTSSARPRTIFVLDERASHVSGELAPEDVLLVIRDAWPRLERCVARATEPLGGRIVARLRIGPDGTPREAIPTPTAEANDAIAMACFERALGALRFEPATGTSTAEILMRFEAARGVRD